MYDQAVNTYTSIIGFVPECLTQTMCNKAVERCFLYQILFLINIKLQKCIIELLLNDPLLIVYCPDKYITQKMCDESVDIL